MINDEIEVIQFFDDDNLFQHPLHRQLFKEVQREEGHVDSIINSISDIELLSISNQEAAASNLIEEVTDENGRVLTLEGLDPAILEQSSEDHDNKSSAILEQGSEDYDDESSNKSSSSEDNDDDDDNDEGDDEDHDNDAPQSTR